MTNQNNAIQHAWLFDVDGVITDPQAKQVTNPEIIKVISHLLEKNEPVSLITGRSIAWLENRVLHLIEQSQQNLSNFFVSAEKGGVFGSYDDSHKLRLEIDKNLEVPKPVKVQIEKLIKQKFPKIIFFDPKKTMASVEMIDGISTEEFKKVQPKLDRLIAEILKKYKLDKKFRIDSVRISTDIENVIAGKNLGARRFLDWLNQKNIKVKKFYAFGDSVSDAEMARELHEDSQDVTFVFVGGREMIKNKYPFPVIFPQSLFTKGVIEFISSLNTRYN